MCQNTDLGLFVEQALNEKVSYVGEKLDWSESDRDPVSDDVSAMERMLQKIDSSVRDADQTAKKINQVCSLYISPHSGGISNYG